MVGVRLLPWRHGVLARCTASRAPALLLLLRYAPGATSVLGTAGAKWHRGGACRHSSSSVGEAARRPAPRRLRSQPSPGPARSSETIWGFLLPFGSNPAGGIQVHRDSWGVLRLPTGEGLLLLPLLLRHWLLEGQYLQRQQQQQLGSAMMKCSSGQQHPAPA